MTQKESLDILKMGHSVFLTGAAGTGKTFVLNEYLNYLKKHSVSPAVTASTGIAATHIGGQTIHSWSGIGIIEKLDKYTLDKLEQNEKLYQKYQNVRVLVIDEISMLHASRLDMINTLFKKLKRDSKPFGGVQIIFCGDFFQLPPVVKGENLNIERHFAYNSASWKELNPVICYLKENYRQEENDELLHILNNIRFEKDKINNYKKLEEKTKEKNNDSEMIKLYTHNIDVDSINLEKYNELNKDNKEYKFEMTSHGKKHLIENLKNNILAPEILNLKVGTKVMFVKNDINKKYQNGTLGEIIDFDDRDKPIIKTFNEKIISVDYENWDYIDENGKVLASISQIPLRYAWAITIHKSQGMTLDAAEIDLGKAFGSSMGYVALSRVKKFKNINLISINTEALEINKDILSQDKIFKDKSERASIALEKYYENLEMKNKLKKKQDDFILSCDGDLNEKEIIIENIEGKTKVKTIFVTLEFLKEKNLPSIIAEKRNLTIGTIISHIEELFERKDINKDDLLYILKDIEKKYEKEDFKKINKILKEDKGLKAKFDKLNNKEKIYIDFHTLKLLRIFI